MSQEYAWPASGRAESEERARPLARTPRPLGDFEPLLGLAGLGQAFDLCVVGVLALTVFPQLFFGDGGTSRAGVGCVFGGVFARPFAEHQEVR